MERRYLDDIPFFVFPELEAEAGLIHAVTTRHGGVSQGPFASLNLGGTEDSPAAVAQNHELVRQALGLDALAYNHQVHGDQVILVEGEAQNPRAQADGLATRTGGVGLMIKQADCQSLILYDPWQRALANLHVGWRGNVCDMPAQGVRFMAQRFGVDPGRLWAAVGPGLGACCAEFVNWREELPESFLPFRVGDNHFDLKAITKAQLIAAGVDPELILVAPQCTKCDPEFYSYRREGRTGRFATIAALV